MVDERLVAKGWAYIRRSPSQVNWAGNITGVGTSAGVTVLEFDPAFVNHRYAVIASSTAGYVVIQSNSPDRVELHSYDHRGNHVDGEVSVAVFGDLA